MNWTRMQWLSTQKGPGGLILSFAVDAVAV
jgi:hypothetical protein